MTTSSQSAAEALYGNRFLTERVPSTSFPQGGMRPVDAMRLVDEDLDLEGDPQRNLATFVTTWMEPEAQRIIAENLHRNFIDHAEYPISAEIEQRCVRMLADLFNAPGADDGLPHPRIVRGDHARRAVPEVEVEGTPRGGEPLDGPAEPRLRRRRPRGVGEVLSLLRRRTTDRPARGGQVHDRPRGRGAAPRREHDRRRRRPGHHVHRSHGRHRRHQQPAARRQEPSRPGHPPPRGRRQRRLRVAVPLSRLRGTSASSRCAPSTCRATSTGSSTRGSAG